MNLKFTRLHIMYLHYLEKISREISDVEHDIVQLLQV